MGFVKTEREPLDYYALKTRELSHAAFWSWQFFSYLTWTPALDFAPYLQLTAVFNGTAVQALIDGGTTALGKQWSRDLQGVRSH